MVDQKYLSSYLILLMNSDDLLHGGVKGKSKAIALLKVLDAGSSILWDPRFDSLSSQFHEFSYVVVLIV